MRAHRPRLVIVALALVLGLISLGCDRHEPIVVPDGAQQVKVLVSDGMITLTPDTVRAGEVYLVLAQGSDAGYSFIARQDAPGVTFGPFSDDQVSRVVQGDAYHTYTDDFGQGCADIAKEAPHCGAYGPLVLTAGKYVFTGPGWELREVEPDASFVPDESVAVLTVRP